MAIRPVDFDLNKNMFLDEPKNTGDDEILALWAQRNDIPLISVDNTHCVMYAQDYDRKIGLYYIHKIENHKFKVLNEYSGWRLVTCVPQKVSNESKVL